MHNIKIAAFPIEPLSTNLAVQHKIKLSAVPCHTNLTTEIKYV
jgi:hypothetical protein